MNPNHASIPMENYATALASVARAAASRRQILNLFAPSPAMTAAAAAASPGMASAFGLNNNAAKHQLTNELLMAQTANRTLKQELASKVREVDELRLRYFTDRNLGVAALENDRILKESLEALDAKNRAQAREISSLRRQLQNKNENEKGKDCISKDKKSGNKGNNNNNDNDNDNTAGDNKLPPLHHSAQPSTYSVEEERAIQDASFSIRCRLVQGKNGCPLCLTQKHTLLNCDVLRSNGYLVTYHSLLDTSACPAAAATNTSYNYRYSGSTIKTQTDPASMLSPLAAEAARKISWGAAATITPPNNSQKQPIDLLSDSDDESDTNGYSKEARTREIGAHETLDGENETKRNAGAEQSDENDTNHIFADIVRSIGESIDGRGVKHKPITIDFDKAEEEEEEEEEEEIEQQNERMELETQSVAESQMEPRESRQSKDNANEEDTEIEIVGETGKNALSDFAHPRFDCVTKPFSKDPEAFCCNCFCYVCDVRACDCEQWDNRGEDSHCFADSKINKWYRKRGRVRSKRKRPERALKEIEFFLPDSVPMKLPPKRRTRNPAYSSMIGRNRNIRQRKKQSPK